MVVLPVLFLLGSLFHCGRMEAQSISASELLNQAALQWKGPVTCDKWDCNCAFKERGCCCAAKDMFQLEEDTFMRMKHLWQCISTLNHRVHALTDGIHVAFKATMNQNNTTPGSTENCFGPFNTNVPIPYSVVTLNHDNAYNPSLGIFTARTAGIYVFSFTVYSYVTEYGRLYYKVQLMKNGNIIASMWEDNREDSEDNANQVVVLELQRGDQVYVELVSGRKLCKYLEYNIFTGYILYPQPSPYIIDFNF